MHPTGTELHFSQIYIIFILTGKFNENLTMDFGDEELKRNLAVHIEIAGIL